MERENKNKSPKSEDHQQPWNQNVDKSSAFSRLKWFYDCLYVGLGNMIALLQEYGYDLEGIDAKLGNKMMLHVPKLNTILLFMTRYHNLLAFFKY